MDLPKMAMDAANAAVDAVTAPGRAIGQMIDDAKAAQAEREAEKAKERRQAKLERIKREAEEREVARIAAEEARRRAEEAAEKARIAREEHIAQLRDMDTRELLVQAMLVLEELDRRVNALEKQAGIVAEAVSSIESTMQSMQSEVGSVHWVVDSIQSEVSSMHSGY